MAAGETSDRIIEARDITVAYGGRRIIQDISFTVEAGERLFIAGGSGCGKSTLLRAIVGLAPLSKGQIVLAGVNTQKAEAGQLESLYRKVGVLFQSGALFASMTLAENVSLPLLDFARLKPAAALDIARMKLGLVGLAGYENYLPAEISGGMQKRAGLARAMALDPLVLFLDEPSAGLDPITSAELDQLILELNQGLKTTMVVVSHELASITAVAERIIMLEKDRAGILAMGAVDEMKASPQRKVRDFFNRRLERGPDGQGN
jgi:phospholipid/cholesterol/gamma-HCH transport system ATP-binding protein